MRILEVTQNENPLMQKLEKHKEMREECCKIGNCGLWIGPAKGGQKREG